MHACTFASVAALPLPIYAIAITMSIGAVDAAVALVLLLLLLLLRYYYYFGMRALCLRPPILITTTITIVLVAACSHLVSVFGAAARQGALELAHLCPNLNSIDFFLHICKYVCVCVVVAVPDGRIVICKRVYCCRVCARQSRHTITPRRSDVQSEQHQRQ